MKNMLIAGNWKMNTNTFESEKLAEFIAGGINKINAVKILVCPPFTSISSVNGIVRNTDVRLGAQNCHFEPKGAFTGETSISMLKHLDCQYIIIGHSERRILFFETDELVNIKTKAVIAAEIIPVVCIGETLEERKSEKTFEVLARQIVEGLKGIDAASAKQIVVAYEPVWAIGSGLSATTDQVNEAHTFIRAELRKLFDNSADDIHILYGGSVNDQNAEEILSIRDVNGALIGGAALKADVFLSIIETAEEIAKR